MIKNILAISVACFIFLVGCEGDSGSYDETGSQSDANPGQDSNADNTNILTGIFVDSAVEGASYSTSTQSGTTNAAGEFNYLEGEQVEFSIGTTVLPSVKAGPQVSPVDMASGSNNPEDTTTNIARLLQSLDIDANPDNGITISAEAASSAASLNFDVTTDQFAKDPAVINLVSNSGSINAALISAEDANSHLNDTIGITAETSTDGLWIRNSAATNESGLEDYTFIDGLDVSRYNSTAGSCYTVSTFTATSLGNNRYQLNTDNGQVFYTAVRVGDTLEVTFDLEATLTYPLAVGVDLNTLPICDE